MAHLRIILALFILLEVIDFASESPITSFNITDTALTEKWSFGNDWYAYVKAHLFNITCFKFCQDGTNPKSTGISVARVWIYLISHRKNICENFGIFSDEALNRKYSQLRYRFSVCGMISKRLSLYMTPNHLLNTSWVFQVHVHKHFIINITFLSLEGRFHTSCLAVRAVVEENYDENQKRYHWPFCPGNPPRSFYSTGNVADIHLQTSPTYRRLFIKNNFFNEWIGILTFQYQIQDNDISLDIDTLIPTEFAKHMIHEYFYTSYQNYDVEFWTYSIIKRQTLNISLDNRMSNISTLYDISDRYLNIICYMVYESKYIVSYFFFFQSFLGATFVIIEGSLFCNKSQAALIAFEGPPVDMVRMDSLLLRLQEWNCGHTFKPADKNMELKGRIGDMTAVLVVEKVNTIANYSLLLRAEFREIEIPSTFATYQLINLTTKRRMHTMHFNQIKTYFYRVNIDAGKDYVNVAITNMTFNGYTDSACTYGGFFFVLKSIDETRHLGGICSPRGAKQFERLYGRRGMTLPETVIIYVKQYILLTQVHATITFSMDHCWGLFNFLPENAKNLEFFIHVERWGLGTIQESSYYWEGLNSYYRWYGTQNFLGIRRYRENHCMKLQYTLFDNMPQDLLQFIAWEGKSLLGIQHYERMTSTLVKVAFWNTYNYLERFSICVERGLGFFPDNRNDEPYIYLKNPEDEPWSTITFTPKFGIDMACLLFAGAFHIQAEDVDGSPMCFREVGGYMYDAEDPILLKGLCGFPDIHLKVGNQMLGFQRPINDLKCCEIDVLVKSVGNRCITRGFLFRPYGSKYWIVHRWQSNTGTPESVMYRELCNKFMQYYNTEASFIENCIYISIMADLMSCSTQVYYRFSLHYRKAWFQVAASPRKICLADACYIRPIDTSDISWNEAQARCEDKQGSLVSVNSDMEWKMLTYSHLMPWYTYDMFYIGYHTQVNVQVILLKPPKCLYVVVF